MNCGLLLTSGDRLLLTDGDAFTLTSVCEEAEALAEQGAFGGTPYTRRELDRLIWEEQLVRLLREDEELLCLV